MEQVNQALAQMDQVTQQNAALVEEAAAAAQSLQEQASELSEVVSVFKLDSQHGQPFNTTAMARKNQPAQPPTAKRVAAATQHKQPLALRPKLAAAGAGGDWEEF
jgi:methyl-accepting chemotaxis protein